MNLRTFRIGGVHPEENKITAEMATQVAPLPKQAIFPLGQHIGAPAKPVVAKGDKVKVGTLIAEAGGFVSAPIYSSVSGTVFKVDTSIDATGYRKPCIIINVEGDEWEESIDRSEKLETLEAHSDLTPEEIVNRIKVAGVTGMGGAGFPTFIKLCPPPGAKAECVIINGVECEPYLTSDHRTMLEHGEEEPPFDPSILDDPDLQELPEEPAEPEPSKDEIAEQEYRDSDGDFDAAEDAPAPERKASGRQRPVKKGRPKKTRGEGLLGIPHILVTIVWLALIVVIGVTLGRMIWVCAADVLAFGRENKPVTITVYESDTMDSITDKLYNAGLIRYKSLFNFYADISHAEKKIDPGIYDLNTRYDYHALVNMMSASSTREVVEDLLIPEGYTCRQIFALLEENRICTAQDLSAYAANGALKDYWFLENVTRGDKYCLEGFLFPDTYDFYKNSSPREVLEKMLDNFDYRFSEEMRAQIDTLNATVTDGSFTVREVTIVASLIEKETASASESPRIAGVIYNRLFHWDYPALLNIDAAIIYAQDGVSDHIDTSLDSPYNTYLHVGLTPTPIANPGLASLQAALNPESHNYYYYVLNPATGAHQFSTTQEEHEQYRAQFAAAAAAASTQSEGE